MSMVKELRRGRNVTAISCRPPQVKVSVKLRDSRNSTKELVVGVIYWGCGNY